MIPSGTIAGRKIQLVSGVGFGPTPIAAFDRALVLAGIANFNLIGLSSVIPFGSVIESKQFERKESDYGNRLYVVLSRCYAVKEGDTACAGLGWAQHIDGRGLFVEVSGSDVAKVKYEILVSLEAMMSSRPAIRYGSVKMRLEKVTCESSPVCALVAAVYKSEEW